MPHKDLENQALAAQDALKALARTVAQIPGLNLNLIRSIELLGELAEWASEGRANIEQFDLLPRTLAGGLNPKAGIFEMSHAFAPALRVPTASEIISAQAKSNGAKGGSRRTPAQKATLAKARAALAAKRAAKSNLSLPAPARTNNTSKAPAC